MTCECPWGNFESHMNRRIERVYTNADLQKGWALSNDFTIQKKIKPGFESINSYTMAFMCFQYVVKDENLKNKDNRVLILFDDTNCTYGPNHIIFQRMAQQFLPGQADLQQYTKPKLCIGEINKIKKQYYLAFTFSPEQQNELVLRIYSKKPELMPDCWRLFIIKLVQNIKTYQQKFFNKPNDFLSKTIQDIQIFEFRTVYESDSYVDVDIEQDSLNIKDIKQINIIEDFSLLNILEAQKNNQRVIKQKHECKIKNKKGRSLFYYCKNLENFNVNVYVQHQDQPLKDILKLASIPLDYIQLDDIAFLLVSRKEETFKHVLRYINLTHLQELKFDESQQFQCASDRIKKFIEINGNSYLNMPLFSCEVILVDKNIKQIIASEELMQYNIFKEFQGIVIKVCKSPLKLPLYMTFGDDNIIRSAAEKLLPYIHCNNDKILSYYNLKYSSLKSGELFSEQFANLLQCVQSLVFQELQNVKIKLAKGSSMNNQEVQNLLKKLNIQPSKTEDHMKTGDNNNEVQNNFFVIKNPVQDVSKINQNLVNQNQVIVGSDKVQEQGKLQEDQQQLIQVQTHIDVCNNDKKVQESDIEKGNIKSEQKDKEDFNQKDASNQEQPQQIIQQQENTAPVVVTVTQVKTDGEDVVGK